jgi:hypothetical protein
MPKAKTSTKKKTSTGRYRPSNLALFVIVLLTVALGTVTWLFLAMLNVSAGL